MEFFQTIMGKRFFEGHVPRLVKALEKIAEELERANDLKEKELDLADLKDNQGQEKCQWYSKEDCEDCPATYETFFEGCINEEMFNEMARACISCTKGIMNPTFDRKLVCDKCGEVIPAKKIL